MAMLFENALDEFSLDEFLKFSPDPVSALNCTDITCTRITCCHNNITTDIWDKFNLSSLPTPPLSPDQQVQLKAEDDTVDIESDFLKIESDLFKTEPFDYSMDAEVERYFNFQPNNYVINDKIWCDDKTLTSTPNPIDVSMQCETTSASFLKLRTPTLDLSSLATNIIRPITPPTPIKIEERTPVKMFSPKKLQKPLSVRRTPLKFELGTFPLVNIKEEPRSPSPVKTKGVTSRSEPVHPVIHIKDEPMDYDSSCVVTSVVSVKDEKAALCPAPPRGAGPRKQQLLPQFRDIPDFRTMQSYKRITPGSIKTEAKSSTVPHAETHAPCTRSTSESSLSEDEADLEDCKIDEVYLKRKLAELSSSDGATISFENDSASPKRRIRQLRYNSTALAEDIANKLSSEQIRNLSINHSHGDEEVCDESCIKRFAHNVLERKRRTDLKRSYELVQNEVPEICDNDKVAKVVILKKSADYIKKIEQEEIDQRAELKRLKAYQRQLINKFLLVKQTAQNKTIKNKN